MDNQWLREVTNQVKLVAFDLDDTLAPSKSPLPTASAEGLVRLLHRYEVAVITGGTYQQITNQVLTRLENNAENEARLTRLHLLPTCGTAYYRWRDGDWQAVYRHDLPDQLRAHIIAVIRRSAKQLGLWESEPAGAIIEDRGSQITYSALGQEAKLEDKRRWDPDGSKRNQLRQAVAEQLPELAVRAGGSTSIDITAQGIDKAYGMRQLQDLVGLQTSQILFIGDRLDEDGNDYPVKRAGYPVFPVANWEDTVAVMAVLNGGE